ncbi:ABC transporter permease [bacterium 1XD42-94]|jgi:spermidine/putrescine transport system permease protein|nr:ABC transporter permease [bacterium 1XD42-76]NBK06013.1 ABC transporter permease [bacterium 1XD42-94]
MLSRQASQEAAHTVNAAGRKRNRWWMTVMPLYLFTIFFVALPIVYLFVLSFLTRAQTWGVVNEFTLDNYLKILKPVYLNTFKESFQMAVLTTLGTLFIGYPFGYLMAKLPKKTKSLMMLCVVIPFWTSALMRMYGWIILFRSNGLLDKVLMGIGLTDSPLKLLYSYPAVLVGMVYSLLPFMILSVYSSTDKMDWSLVEAARDLGATRWTAFFTVTIKMTLPGILSGIILVFIPSMGLFFIADILGGGKVMLVGNLIQNQLQSGRDWPFAAALSVVLMVFTSMMIWIYRKATGVKDLEGLL